MMSVLLQGIALSVLIALAWWVLWAIVGGAMLLVWKTYEFFKRPISRG